MMFFAGGTVTLRYPYFNDIPEPNTYEKIVRHAEGSKAAPISNKALDLHVSYLLLFYFYYYYFYYYYLFLNEPYILCKISGVAMNPSW